MDQDQVVEALRLIARQLEAWAHESERGGWSTHQVRPQRALAAEIYAALGSGDLSKITGSLR